MDRDIDDFIPAPPAPTTHIQSHFQFYNQLTLLNIFRLEFQELNLFMPMATYHKFF